jgi:predicted permease
VTAQAMLTPVFQRAAYEHLEGTPQKGKTPRKLDLLPARGIGQQQAEREKPLYVLLAMVALILVVACGNVAMILAARNSARQREFSIRMAIGGSQARLFRRLLAESLVLVALGALLGWIFTLIATRALASWAGIEVSLAPDSGVLLFTVAISLLVGLIFGLAPLLTAIRVPIGLALKNSSATAFHERSKSRTARAIVVLQVSLCLILTVAAGLFMRTLRNLEHENLGFKSQGLLVFGVNPQLKTHSDAEVSGFYQGLLEKLRALPGVQSVTVMENRIGSGWSNNTGALVDGRDPRAYSPTDSDMMRWNSVGPNYFETLGIPIRMGRDFTDADSYSAPKVAIVNETFARRFLKGREPLGHQVSFTPKLAYTIVGVAANSKYTGVREKDIPMAYFPFTQVQGMGVMHVELRTAGEAARFLPEVRRTVASFGPDLALLQPMRQRTQFEDSISEERLVARLSLFFGGLAGAFGGDRPVWNARLQREPPHLRIRSQNGDRGTEERTALDDLAREHCDLPIGHRNWSAAGFNIDARAGFLALRLGSPRPAYHLPRHAGHYSCEPRCKSSAGSASGLGRSHHCSPLRMIEHHRGCLIGDRLG